MQASGDGKKSIATGMGLVMGAGARGKGVTEVKVRKRTSQWGIGRDFGGFVKTL